MRCVSQVGLTGRVYEEQGPKCSVGLTSGGHGYNDGKVSELF